MELHEVNGGRFVNNRAPKKIVCSLLIGLLQFGGGAYVVEAAAREEQRTQLAAPQDPSKFDRAQQERYWQERRHLQEQELNERRREEALRHEQELRRREQEDEREWKNRLDF